MKVISMLNSLFLSKDSYMLSKAFPNLQNKNRFRKFIPDSHIKLFCSNTKKPVDEFKYGVCPVDCEVHNQSFMNSYNRLLEGNRKFVKEKTSINPSYFKDLAESQTPKYLLIGCSDSRVPPNEMTMTEPGEIFIHRNIANQVIYSDLNCMSVLQFGIEHLKVEHVIVLGHTRCGGIIASKNKTYKGLIENWLQNIRDVAFTNKEELDACKDEEEYFKKLTIFNVKAQVLNVCKTSYVQKAWANKQKLHVHGWLIDIETGLINDLGVTNKEWNQIKNCYEFDFKLN